MDTYHRDVHVAAYSETRTDVQKDWAALLGRILLAGMFVFSGYGKIAGFAGTASNIASKGLPMPEVLAVIAILIEVGAGLAILFGWKARWAALAFMVFLVVITPIFHNFWAVPPELVAAQKINFMKNVSIFGGMMLLFAFGPGRYSVDRG
jgi:putative oxidoreductase